MVEFAGLEHGESGKALAQNTPLDLGHHGVLHRGPFDPQQSHHLADAG